MSNIQIKRLIKAGGLPGYLLLSYNILMFFVTRQRSLNENSVVDLSVILQLIYLSIIFIITMKVFSRNHKKSKILFSKPQIYLLGYVIFCFLSVAWSANSLLTVVRAYETLVFLMLISWVVMHLITHLNSQNVIEWAVLYAIWHLIWSISLNVKLYGLIYLESPFNASRLVVPIFFFLALMLSKKRYFKYIIFTFSILAVSNKIFFGITFGLLGFFFGDIKYRGMLALFFLSILIILNFIDFETLLQNTLFYGRETITMESTTGRDKIWLKAWEAFLQKPLLGYGFVSGENEVLYSGDRGAINAHNSFISALLGTGIFGTSFVLFYFVSVFKQASSNVFPKRKWRPAMVSTFIMCLIISLTAPGVGARVYGSWLPIVLTLTLISGLYLKLKSNKLLNQNNIRNNIVKTTY